MKRRSNKIRVPIHFVWTTQERLPLIPEEGERRLWRYIETICREARCDVLAVGGMPDHIPLLVNFANTLSFAEFMKRVKGGSSRFVSQELLGGGGFAWQAHYGAFGAAPDDIAEVAAYISNQKRHHAEGSVRPEWEETFEEYEVEDGDSRP